MTQNGSSFSVTLDIEHIAESIASYFNRFNRYNLVVEVMHFKTNSQLRFIDGDWEMSFYIRHDYVDPTWEAVRIAYDIMKYRGLETKYLVTEYAPDSPSKSDPVVFVNFGEAYNFAKSLENKLKSAGYTSSGSDRGDGYAFFWYEGSGSAGIGRVIEIRQIGGDDGKQDIANVD